MDVYVCIYSRTRTEYHSDAGMMYPEKSPICLYSCVYVYVCMCMQTKYESWVGMHGHVSQTSQCTPSRSFLRRRLTHDFHPHKVLYLRCTLYQSHHDQYVFVLITVLPKYESCWCNVDIRWSIHPSIHPATIHPFLPSLPSPTLSSFSIPFLFPPTIHCF